MQHANVFASEILTGGQREYDRCVRFLDRCTFHPADFQIGGILRNGVQRNAQFPLLRLLTGVECLADKSFQLIFGRGALKHCGNGQIGVNIRCALVQQRVQFVCLADVIADRCVVCYNVLQHVTNIIAQCVLTCGNSRICGNAHIDGYGYIDLYINVNIQLAGVLRFGRVFAPILDRRPLGGKGHVAGDIEFLTGVVDQRKVRVFHLPAGEHKPSLCGRSRCISLAIIHSGSLRILAVDNRQGAGKLFEFGGYGVILRIITGVKSDFIDCTFALAIYLDIFKATPRNAIKEKTESNQPVNSWKLS